VDLLLLIHECGSNERELFDPLPLGALGCELPWSMPCWTLTDRRTPP
jgi:hypothetical protein